MGGRNFVVMLSGGGGSWAAGRRIVDKHGAEDVTLVFTDVKGADDNPYLGEDDDTYRFLRDAAEDLAAPLIWLQDGRDIWDVFFRRGWLGNASLSHCSWELKTLPARRWLAANRDPADTVVVVGMDWTEAHRHAGVHRNYAHTIDGCADPKLCRSLFDDEGRLPGPGCKNLLRQPWAVQLPMTGRPLIAKPQTIAWMKQRGLRPPRLYSMGFAHANCVGCVKGGQAHWRRVLEVFPDHFAYAERREQEFRDSKASRANASILKDRIGGETRPLPLREFRVRIEQQNTGTLDLDFDWGGCGCLTDALAVID